MVQTPHSDPPSRVADDPGIDDRYTMEVYKEITILGGRPAI